MMRSGAVFLVLMSWPLCANAAFVDTVTVKDGSVLKGEIKRVDSDELILGTDYADDVSIDVHHIAAIDSERRHPVRLVTGEKISGSLTVVDGRIVLREQPVLPGGAEEAAGGAARSGGRAFDVDEVDWVRETPSYYRYDAELNVGAQSSSGNSDTTDLHFDALFEPTFGSNTLRFIGEFDRKEAEGNTTTDRWLASLAYERDIGRRWFVGATNIYEGDALRNLDLRIITTAGVGYRFYDEGPTRLSVQPGIAYVIENFEEQDDNTSYPAVRWKTDFTRDLYKHAITFFHNDQYLNNLQDLDDVTIETRTGIEFDLAWNLKMSAEFQSEWDNQPAEDADKTDTRWILKIGYEFGGDEEDWFH